MGTNDEFMKIFNYVEGEEEQLIKTLPKFRYHPNLYNNEIVHFDDGICQCCGKKVKAYIDQMYTQEEIDCICLDCVSNGSAVKKFGGCFIQDAEKVIKDEKKTEELFHKTPGYMSWQGEYWLTCCNDYCEFIEDVGTKELEDLEIANEVFEDYEKRNEYKNVRANLVKGGSPSGYLFKCKHCGKYRIWVDSD